MLFRSSVHPGLQENHALEVLLQLGQCLLQRRQRGVAVDLGLVRDPAVWRSPLFRNHVAERLGMRFTADQGPRKHYTLKQGVYSAWIIDRANGHGMSKETPIGWVPRYKDIDWTGFDYPEEQFNELQAFDRAAWKAEVLSHEELFIELHNALPKELIYERELLICRM